MANDKDIKTKDPMADDELNSLNFDFAGDQVPDDRTATTKLRDAVIRSSKNKLTDSTTYTKLAKRALPKEYGEAADNIGVVTDTMKKTYDTAAKQVKPVASDLAKQVDKLVPESAKRTKGLLKRIQDWGSDKPTVSNDEEAQRNQNISNELAEVFKFQMQEQVRKDNVDSANQKVQESLSFMRHKDQMSALNNIASSVRNLVLYNSRVNAAYQKKSLELQYRSYYLQADMLKEAKQVGADTVARLDAIAKNTGLPDYVKLRTSEAFKEQLRNQFMQSMGNGLFGSSRDFVKQFAGNLSKKALGSVGKFTQAASAASFGAEQISSMNDMGIGPKTSTLEFGAEIVADNIFDEVMIRLGKKLGGVAGKNKTVQKGARMLGNINRDGASTVREFTRNNYDSDEDDNFGTKAKKMALRGLQGIAQAGMPGSGQNTALETDSLAGMRDVSGGITNQANKSLTEIIPGYLARILRELQVTRTKDESIGLSVYDFQRNKFTTDKKLTADIKESIVSSDTKKDMAYATDNLFRNLPGYDDLSGEEKRELALHVMQQRMQGNSLSAEHLARPGRYSNEKHAEKLSGLFRQGFNIGADGKIMDEESKVRDSAFRDRAARYGDSIKNNNSLIQGHVNAGQLEQLRATGYYDEASGGINIDKILRDSVSGVGRTAASDVNVKEGITKFDPKQALSMIGKVPVSQWQYKKDSAHFDGKQHIGPMAQDVNATMGEKFAPGGKKIDLVNLNGLAMSGIQGLNARMKQLEGDDSGTNPQVKLLTDIEKNTRALAIISVSNGGANGIRGKDRTNSQILKDVLGDSTYLASGLGKAVLDELGNQYNAGKRRVKDAYDNVIAPAGRKAKELALSAFDKAKDQYDIAKESWDLYIEGEAKPRITKAKMQAGYYRDKATGKVITTLSDIKGDVIDISGQVVATVEDLKKAKILFGANNTIVSIGRTVFGYLQNKYDQVMGVGNFFVRQAKKMALGAIRFGKDILDEPRDVYVRGENKPRLYAAIMKTSGYYLKHNGSPIQRPSDIIGEVTDAGGNILLSAEDLSKGITDVEGNKIIKPGIKLVGLAFGAARAGLKMLSNLNLRGMEALGGLGRGFSNGISGMLEKLSGGAWGRETVDILKKIHTLLDARLPGGKPKVAGDKDGDGDRDGGLQDKMQQQNEIDKEVKKELAVQKAMSKPENRAKAKHHETKNAFDLIAEKAAGLKGLLGFGGEGGGGIDINTNGGSGQTRRDRAKERLKRMRAKAAGAKPGLLSRMGSGIASGARTVGGGLMNAAGSVLGGKIGQAGGAIANAGRAAATAGSGSMIGRGLAGVAKGTWGLTKGTFGLGAKGIGLLGRGVGMMGSKLLPGLGTAYGLYQGYNDIKDGNYGSAALNLGLAGVSGAGLLGGTAGLAGLGGALMTGAGAAAGGIAAILGSPVVLGAAIVGGLGYGGYKLYKYATKKRYKDVSLLRMIQYGLAPGDEAEHQLMNQVEKELQKAVSFDAQAGTAKIDDKGVNVSKVLDIFDIKDSDEKERDRFVTWFQERFKPVFLTHMAALKAVSGEKDLEKVETLSVEDKLKMLAKVEMPNGPWGIDVLPFKDKSKSIVTAEQVKNAVIGVRSELEKNKKDGSGKGLGDKNQVITAMGATAVNTAFKDKTAKEGGASVISNEQGAKEALDLKNAENQAKYGAFAPKLAATTVVTSTLAKGAIGSSLSALQAIRYRAYGLEKLTADQVVALRALEELTLKDTYFKAGASAEWTGKIDQVLQRARQYFGFGVFDSKMNESFTVWYKNRFLPLWLDFAAAINQSTGSDKVLEMESTIKPDQALFTARALIGKAGAWSITNSPWKDITLTSDSKLCDENLQYLVSTAKSYELTAPKGTEGAKGEGGKGTGIQLTGGEGGKETTTFEERRQKYVQESLQREAAYNQKLGLPGSSDEGEKDVPSTSTISPQSRATLAGVPTKAGGDVNEGASGMQYVNLVGGATLDGMNPAMKKLFLGMAQEYGETTGKKIQVNSGFRTREQQEKEYRANPRKAAKPGSSLHEYGLAVDISSATANELDKLGLMRKYGLTRPVGGEPWHVEPAGIQTDPKGYRTKPGEAAEAIMAGQGKGGGGFGTDKSAQKYARNPELAKRLLTTDAASADVKSNVKPEPETGKEVAATITNGGIAKVPPAGKSGTGDSGTGSGAMAIGPSTKPAGSSGGGSSDTGISQTAKDDYAKMTKPNGNGKGWGDMQATVMEAAKLTGTDPKELATIMAIESGFNPNAKAKTSSATGLNQFTSDTWKEMMGKHASKFGIDPNTPPTDPRANAIMGAMFLKQNKNSLKKTKSDLTLTDSYMAHFLGAGGANQFLKMPDDAIPAQTMQDAASANKSIFFDKGRPRTKAEIYKLMENKVNGALSKHGVTIDGASPTTGSTDSASMPKGPDSADNKAVRDFQNNSGLYKDTAKPKMPASASIGSETAKGFESSDLPTVTTSKALAPLAKHPEPVPTFESARVNTSVSAMQKNAGTVEDLLSKSLEEHRKIAANTATMVELLTAFNANKESGVGSKGDAPPKVTNPNESVRSYSPDRSAKLVSSSPVSLRHNF